MMILPTIILFFLIITKRDPMEGIFDEKILEKLRFDNEALGKMGRNLLIFVALLLMIIALARPVLPKGDVKVSKKSIDMLVAIDVSKSMLAKDIYPNRLEFAKKRFKEFVDKFDEANVGVIAFSSDAFLVSPMTQDSSTLKFLVDNLSLDSMSLKGTNILIPILKAKDFLKKSKDKIVIIFSDGGDDEDFSQAIKVAKDNNESIYIYAIGSNQGAPILENSKALKDKNGNIVLTKLNPHIKDLVLKTGGAYIVANYKDKSVELMVEDIKKKFRAKEIKSKMSKDYKELFYYPLSLALLFMLFLFHSLPKKSGVIIVVALFALSDVRVEARVFDFFDIKKAEDAYSKEDYKKAISYFQKVAISKRDNESFYDLANAYYKAGKYKKALKVYADIRSIDESLNYKKYFNIGNSYFKLGKFEDALKAYNRAKEIKSEPDLKHNIELAKKRLKDRREKQNKKDKKSQNNKKNDKDKQDQKKKDKKDKKKQQDKQDQKKEKKSSSKRQAKPKKEEKLSKKEEKMWQEHLEKSRPKTMPIKIKIDKIKRMSDEKPW